MKHKISVYGRNMVQFEVADMNKVFVMEKGGLQKVFYPQLDTPRRTFLTDLAWQKPLQYAIWRDNDFYFDIPIIRRFRLRDGVILGLYDMCTYKLQEFVKRMFIEGSADILI